MKVIKHKDKWYLQSETGYKEILLSTDDLLIKDGVQAIDDEFLEWFVKNLSCEEVEVVDDTLTVGEMSKLPLGTRNHKYKLIFPKECIITKIMQMDAKMAYDSLPKQERERGITITHVGKPKQETLEVKEGNQPTHQFEEWNSVFELQSKCKKLGFSESEIHSVLSNRFELKKK